jgi:hypothetical protein
MTLVKFRNTIIAASLLCFTAAQGATFGELSGVQSRSWGAPPTPRPPPVLYTAQEPTMPIPWIAGGSSYVTPQHLMQRGYGQQRGFDNPHTWDHLDNPYLWVRWGTPLAPYSSAAINEWWRSRANLPRRNYDFPEWW